MTREHGQGTRTLALAAALVVCLASSGRSSSPAAQQQCRIYCPDGTSYLASCDSTADGCASSSGGSGGSSGGGGLFTRPPNYEAYNHAVAGYDAKIDEINAAIKTNNYREIIRLYKEALKILNTKAGRDRLKYWQKYAADLEYNERQAVNKAAAVTRQQTELAKQQAQLLQQGEPDGKRRDAATTPTSGNPLGVNAQNVASGLPKAVDDAIAGAYRNAPLGVIDRVRKGFQAVNAGDWNVAKAWFQDALNRDPGNAGLKSLVELTQAEPPQPRRQPSPAPTLQLPTDADMLLLFPGEPPKSATPSTPARVTLPTDVLYYVPSQGSFRMTLWEARVRVLVDKTTGGPISGIIPLPEPGDLFYYNFSDNR